MSWQGLSRLAGVMAIVTAVASCASKDADTPEDTQVDLPTEVPDLAAEGADDSADTVDVAGPMDLPGADDAPVQDLFPDPAEDAVTFDAPAVDPAPDSPGSDMSTEMPVPVCEPIPIKCGETVSATTVGGSKWFQSYATCQAGGAATGPERIYAVASDGPQKVAAILDDLLPDEDRLHLFLLGGCEAASCLATNPLTFHVEPGVLRYLVIDGNDGYEGAYTLMVTCAPSDDCANHLDGNGNGLVGCMESECRGLPICAEVCEGGLDEDWNGLVGCEDPSCRYTERCFEASTSCSDSVDGDGDGETDCDDTDCRGNAACAVGPGALGDACESQDDCASGSCWTERESQTAGGQCILGPFVGAWPGNCPAGSWSNNLDDTHYQCLKGCKTNGDCRPGAYCVYEAYCDPGGVGGPPAEQCSGLVDEDLDGWTDCEDADCAFDSPCAPTPFPLAGGKTCAEATPIPVPVGGTGTVAVTGYLDGTTDGDDHEPSCAGENPWGDAELVYSIEVAAPTHVAIDSRGFDSVAVGLGLGCKEPDVACNMCWGYCLQGRSRLEATLNPNTTYYVYQESDGTWGYYTLSVYFRVP